jgi:hypothetical protein
MISITLLFSGASGTVVAYRQILGPTTQHPNTLIKSSNSHKSQVGLVVKKVGKCKASFEKKERHGHKIGTVSRDRVSSPEKAVFLDRFPRILIPALWQEISEMVSFQEESQAREHDVWERVRRNPGPLQDAKSVN